MAKLRIPLPKQVEKVIQDETQYDRRREKQVSLDEVYSDPANQPSQKYMAGLKKLQARATGRNHDH